VQQHINISINQRGRGFKTLHLRSIIKHQIQNAAPVQQNITISISQSGRSLKTLHLCNIIKHQLQNTASVQQIRRRQPEAQQGSAKPLTRRRPAEIYL